MVHHHNGIAISLYELRAIRREFADEGGYLIFEFNNALSLIEDMDTGQWVERSHQNEPVSQYYDDPLDLQESFDAWIQVWNDFVSN